MRRSSVIGVFLLYVSCIFAQEKVYVGWKSGTKTTTSYQFGTNDFDITDPQAAVGTSYRETLKGMGLQFLRFHNEGLPDAWSDASTRNWNVTLIKNQLDNYAAVYGDNFPTIIMTIPVWPSWMSKNSTLDSSLWGEYATFCAGLVTIINVQLGRKIKYWEPFNELDLAYRAAGKLNDMYALYSLTSQAMTKADPSILVGGPAWSWPDPYDTINFLKQGGPNINFISWHSYIEGASSTKLSNWTVLNDTLAYIPLITNMQQAVNSVKPGLPIFMDEYNVFYDWQTSDPRIFGNIGAVWYASVHRIVTEYGLTGSNNWNARDAIFGLLDPSNTLHYPAYIFRWSNTYFVGNLASSTSSAQPLEVIAVQNSAGASIYLINKGSALNVAVTQDTNLMGSSTLLLNKVNASGVYEGLSLQAAELQKGLFLEAESVWCLHHSNS